MGFKRAQSGVVVLGLLLGGCAAIPGFGPPPLDAYDLGAPPLPPAGERRVRTQILVPEPAALQILDGEDIAIRRAGGALQLLGGARWSDRLPILVQARLVEAYQRSQAFGGVGRPGEGLAIDYQLITDIRAFEVRVGGNDHAYVEIFARVLDDRTGVVRASRDFIATAPVPVNGNPAYVQALDQAFKSVASDIVDWSISVL